MKSFQVLTISAVAVLIGSCSGGGRNTVSGNQCPRNYDPVPILPEGDGNPNKIEWQKVTDTLPPGDYVQQSAQLYYVDNDRAPDRNFRLLVVDVKQKDGTWRPDGAAGCSRNARGDLKGLALTTEGVSHMNIDANKAVVTTETRQFGFRVGEDGKVQYNFSAPVQKPGGDPGSIYQGKVQRSFVFKRSEADFEIRSQGVIDTPTQSGTYYLSVILHKQ